MTSVKILHFYYVALSRKDWELSDSGIQLAKIDIDRFSV